MERWVLNTISGIKEKFSVYVIQGKYYDVKRFDNLEKFDSLDIDFIEAKLNFLRKSRLLSIVLDNAIIPFSVLIFARKYKKNLLDSLKDTDTVYLTKNQYWRLFKGKRIIGSCHTELNSDSFLNVLKAKMIGYNLIYKGIDNFHLFPGRDKIKVEIGISKNVFEIPNGTIDKFFEIEKSGSPKFLYVGRLEKIKGIDRLLNLWIKMADESCHLIIVGAGNINARKFSENKSNIYYAGKVDDETLNKLYNEADVFIYPTRWDSFPNTIIEALSGGCYIITSSFLKKAFPEISDNKKIGFTVNNWEDEFEDVLNFVKENLDYIRNSRSERHNLFKEKYELNIVNKKISSMVYNVRKMKEKL
ncbi:glycosyltransferase family 4 protein [Caldiplasma sukawensis]